MSPILGILASQNYPRNVNSYESIATTAVGSGGVASITFSSIPATYTHLQIRLLSKSTNSSATDDGIYFRFNGDSTAKYTRHFLYGTGSSVGSGGANVLQTFMALGDTTTQGNGANFFGVTIADILDYANTNKYKTGRGLGGYDANGSGVVWYSSGSWQNTAAITSVTMTIVGGTYNFAEYSHAALYGIK
jgi:hypothetical protein